MFEIVAGLVAGLVLFLYGVTRLSNALKAAFGERLEHGLARFTRNRFAGVGTGAVATAVVDSSSVTIATVIALVHAGVLPFAHSLGVILGANMRGHAAFTEWMTRLENPFVGLLAGLVATAVLQSSSATLGLAIALAGEGMLTLPAGVAVMLGAEIGTCADTLLASLGRSRAALRAGLFHLLFNAGAALAGLALVSQLTAAAVLMSGGAGGVARQIANAHLLFNVLGVVLVVGFLPRIAGWMYRLVPDEARTAPPSSVPAPMVA